MKIILTFLLVVVYFFSNAQPLVSIADTLFMDGYVGVFTDFREKSGQTEGFVIFREDCMKQVLSSKSYDELLSIPGVYMYLQIENLKIYNMLIWNLLNPSLQNNEFLFSRPQENEITNGVGVKIPIIDRTRFGSCLIKIGSGQKVELKKSKFAYLEVHKVTGQVILVNVRDFRKTDMFSFGTLERDYAEKHEVFQFVLPLCQ